MLECTRRRSQTHTRTTWKYKSGSRTLYSLSAINYSLGPTGNFQSGQNAMQSVLHSAGQASRPSYAFISRSATWVRNFVKRPLRRAISSPRFRNFPSGHRLLFSWVGPNHGVYPIEPASWCEPARPVDFRSRTFFAKVVHIHVPPGI